MSSVPFYFSFLQLLRGLSSNKGYCTWEITYSCKRGMVSQGVILLSAPRSKETWVTVEMICPHLYTEKHPFPFTVAGFVYTHWKELLSWTPSIMKLLAHTSEGTANISSLQLALLRTSHSKFRGEGYSL